MEIGPLEIVAGGCVSNTGKTLVGLGHDVAMSAAIGDDHLGDVVRQILTDEGLDVRSLVATPTAATSYSIVLERPGANRSFWHHVGANAVFDGDHVVLDACDLLHLGYPPLLPALTADGGTPLVALLSRARALGLTTSIDMAVVDPASPAGEVDWKTLLARVLPLTDVFSPSLDDLISALRLEHQQDSAAVADLAEELVGQGPGIVVVSAGENGLFLKAGSAERLARGGRVVAPLAREWADAQLWLPAEKLERVVTTNGAGDAATAGLLHGLVERMDPAAALGSARSAAMSRICGGAPAQPPPQHSN